MGIVLIVQSEKPPPPPPTIAVNYLIMTTKSRIRSLHVKAVMLARYSAYAI